MKKIISIVFLFISLVFASCSKYETTEIHIYPNKPDAELIVKIMSENQVNGVKSVGYDDRNYKETRITNALIATFFQDGSLNVIKKTRSMSMIILTKESALSFLLNQEILKLML